MKKALEILSEEDLTPDMRMVADICGLETVKILLINLGGIDIYIPKISKLDNFIRKYIEANFTKTFKEIACELKVSVQFIKKIAEIRRISNTN